MYYDNPFLTEEQRTAMKAATAAAHLMTDLKTASAGLKHVKAIATFDEEVADLPLFPDLRQCGGDSQKFASEVATMMKHAEAMKLDLHMESQHMANRQQAVGADFKGVPPDHPNPRLAHFLQLRRNKHKWRRENICELPRDGA